MGGWRQTSQHVAGIVDRLRKNVELTAVTTAFVDLHEQRERADYDHFAEFARPGTHALVRESERAVALIEECGTDNDFKTFFGLVVLRTSIRTG